MSEKKYLKSSLWIFAEYGVRTIAAIFVGIYVARYLGPERFGIFSLYLAIAAIVASGTRLGLDSILVKEIVLRPDSALNSMASAFWLMQAAGIFIVALLCLGGYLFSNGQSFIVLFYVLFASGQIIFQPFSFVESYYQATGDAGSVSIAKAAVVVLFSAVKLWSVHLNADLIIFFAIAFLEQLAQAGLFLFLWLRRHSASIFFLASSADGKRLLQTSWPLLVSALAINLYTKIDQVMINSMLGHEAGGLYSAAIKIYDAWSALPYLVSIAFFPVILSAKKISEFSFERKIIQLMRLVFWASMLVALFCFVFSSEIIHYSFGENFSSSAPMLGIVMFSSVWVALGSVSSRYLISVGLEKYIAARTLLSAALNIILNLVLIPKFGALGAIYATLACAFLVNYVLDFTTKKLKRLLQIKNSAIFFWPLSSLK